MPEAASLVGGGGRVVARVGRYYRAPELILDRNQYTTKVDIWAFGCLLGELAKGSPLFLGEDITTQASSHMSTSSR